MDGKEIGGLYLSLGLDVSKLNRGFEDAGKIVAENMAKLQKEVGSLFGEFQKLDSGMHEAAHFSEEELKAHNEEVARSKSNGRRGYYSVHETTVNKPEWEFNDLLKSAWSYRRRAANAQAELDFGDDDYQKALAKLNVEYDLAMEKFRNFEEGRIAVSEYYKTKRAQLDEQLAQIQRKHAEEIQQYWQNAADIEYKLIHSAFEKQLRDIEQWKEAQKEKAASAEDTAAIIAESAAKEAEAFEAAMDRIKGKLQSLDDKIFAQEHSQYEQDRRRIEQERLEYYDFFQEQGALTDNARDKIERWYSNAVGKLNQRAKQGGDYTKPPEGAIQRGGNGIMVIGADQIIDDGKLNQSIGLIADESQERAQLMQNLSQEGRERVAAIQSLKQLNDAQKQFAQQTSGFQLIEGDRFTNQPAAPQVIEGDQVVADVQQFGEAVQQSTDPVQALKD